MCQIESFYFEERFVLPLIHFIDIFVSLVSLPLHFVQIFQHEFVLYLDMIWSAGWDQFLSNLQTPIVLDFAIDWFMWNNRTSAWIRAEQDISPNNIFKIKGRLHRKSKTGDYLLLFFYFKNYNLTNCLLPEMNRIPFSNKLSRNWDGPKFVVNSLCRMNLLWSLKCMWI